MVDFEKTKLINFHLNAVWFLIQFLIIITKWPVNMFSHSYCSLCSCLGRIGIYLICHHVEFGCQIQHEGHVIGVGGIHEL